MATDVAGEYKFRSLASGSYVVWAGKAGFGTVPYGQRGRYQRGQLVEVAQGQLVDGINFDLPAGGVIVGRLVDEQGEPVPNAAITAGRQDTVSSLSERAVSSAVFELDSSVVHTDDRGLFRLFSLSPGRYLVSAAASGVPHETDVGVCGVSRYSAADVSHSFVTA